MSNYTEPMFWSGNNCVQPGEIAQIGYQAGDNPAAEHENYFRRQMYLCIKELQSYLFNIADTVQFQNDTQGGFYYLNDDGERLHGETRINGIPYPFAADGTLKTGWQTVFGKRYYYSPEDGNIILGWLTYQGNKYYTTLMDGKIFSQYRTIDGVDYHFDENGAASEVTSA